MIAYPGLSRWYIDRLGLLWRLSLCFSLSFVVGLLTAALVRGQAARDFTWLYAGAVQLRSGVNPYLDLGAIIPAWWQNGRTTPLFYPLPAVLVALPFSYLPVEAAGVAFSTVSAFLLAWALTSTGQYWRLWTFASAPAIIAFGNVQWSPLLLASVYLWWLSPVVLCKPSLGAAAFAACPRWLPMAAGLFILPWSLLVLPSWPIDWISNLSRSEHLAPVLYGVPGLLALSFLATWALPAGRFFFVWSLVPQMAFFYDALLLWLLPATKKQLLYLVVCSWVAVALLPEGHPTYAARLVEYWLIYLPALSLLLFQWVQKRGSLHA